MSKCFLSSAVVHQLFDKIHHPIEFRSLSYLPDASNLLCGPINLSSVCEHQKIVANVPAPLGNPRGHLQNRIGEKSYGKGSTKYALCTALNSCAKTLDWCLGVQIHGLIIHNGYEDNLILNSALVDFYAKSGLIEDARRVFDSMKHHDQVSWSSIISGYGQSGRITEAISLFKEMLATHVKPNSFTYVSVIKSCAVAKTKLEQGFAQHGRALEGLKLFDHSMMEGSFIPDHVCFTALLTACNHAGLLDEGVDYFNKMTDCGLAPNLDQYACLIDLFARKGHIEKAKQLMEEMPFNTNNVMLSSFLSSCRSYGAIKPGTEAANQLIRLQPDDVPTYVTLARIYAEAGLWDQVAYFKKLMEEKGSRKRDGWSWIEVDRT